MTRLLLGLLLGCGGETEPPPSPAADPLEVDAGPDRAVAVGEALDLRGAVSGGSATWDLGDGTVLPGAEVLHVYQAPGNHIATLTVSGAGGASLSESITITAYRPQADPPPVSASRMALDEVHGRLWVPVPEADTVAVLSVDGQVEAWLPTCAGPTWVAHAEGVVAVSCPDGGRVARFDAAALAPLDGLELGEGRRPSGLVGRAGTWWIAEPALGQLLRWADGLPATVDGCPDVHTLALDPDGRALAPRFRAASVSGEAHAQLGLHLPAAPTCEPLPLAHDPGPDSDTAHRGVPNLLDAVAISPDGGWLYVGGLTANVQRGLYRDGQPLTFESTVRAMLRVVELNGSPREHLDRRKVFDNQDRVSAVALSPLGNWLWVAHSGTHAIQRLDAYSFAIRGGIPNAGRGIQAMAVSADGRTLYVHAWLDRAVHAYALDPIEQPTLRWSAPTVPAEPLAPAVLRGKRLFHETADTRLAKHGYVSCATCHPDGDHDGLTWDFTDRGEGLRNTLSLLGRGGLDMGRLHWTGNFDEVQDFEADIRHGQGGSGLLPDADWEDPDIRDPLGAPKAGRSPDLDALAAYVHSLTEPLPSPHPPHPDGEAVFYAHGCDTCHDPARLYTDSALGDDAPLHDIGTLTPASGQRLGGPLPGLDTPTLHGLWASAPYLHDGSADTLAAAVLAHAEPPVDLTAEELADLVAWLRSL